MNEAVERSRRGSFRRGQRKASGEGQVGKTARQKERRKSELGDRQALEVSGKKKKAGLQEHKAPGGHSRNMRLKSWIEPTGQTV